MKKNLTTVISVLVAAALIAAACGGDDTATPTTTTAEPTTTTLAPDAPPPDTTVPEEVPDLVDEEMPDGSTTTVAVSDAPDLDEGTGMTDGPSLGVLVHSFLSEDPPPGVTDADVQCVTDAVTGAFSTERSDEVALALADGIAQLGIPIDVVTSEEADLIAASAEPCIDWAAALAGNFAVDDPSVPPGLSDCFTAASQNEGFPQAALRGAIFDSPEAEATLLSFVADCLADVFRAEQAASLELAGVSPEGQACVIEAMDFDFLTQTMVERTTTDDDTAGLAMLDMMSALAGCLTEEELQNVLGPMPNES